jgi:hypothetical protein
MPMRNQVMRKLAVVCCMALCALGTGCHLTNNAVRTVSAEFKRTSDERKEKERNRQLADAVWQDVQTSSVGFCRRVAT